MIAAPGRDDESREATYAAMASAFAHWFGLTRGAASVLTQLYLAGEPMGPLILSARTDAGAATITRVHIPSLRGALADDSVDCLPGRGYALTETGKAECQRALIKVGDELRAAA